MLALHALRIELGKSYRQTIDLLSEMPGVLEELGLTRLPHFTALRNSFATIPTARWRAFLGRSAEKRSGHAAIDTTGFDRDQPSRYYAQRAHYRVRSLKVTCARWRRDVVRYRCPLHDDEETRCEDRFYSDLRTERSYGTRYAETGRRHSVRDR